MAEFSIELIDKPPHQQPGKRTSPLHIINGHERLRIEPWGHNSIRVRASLYRDGTGNELGALLETPLNECGTECLESPSKISYHNNSAVQNGLIEVSVSKNKLRFWRMNGISRELLFEELWPQHGRIARDWSFDTAGVTSRPCATFSFTMEKDEQIFGLGQHQTGNLNKKPGTYNFRHYQSETTIPFFISSKTYGFLWNVPSMGHVTLDDNRIQWFTESAMVIDYVVSVAEKGDFRTLMKTHSSLTGRAPSFPKYGRGYIQSKTTYINQNEVLRVAEGFKKHKIPVSMIQIDAPHWRAFGDFAFDRLKFPDLALLVETVRKLTNGARIIASIWPLMEPSSENWLDYISSGLVAGSTQGTGVVEFFNGTAMHLLDYTNPMTRNKTWSKIIDNYYNIGIRDFLLDCTEGGGVGEGFSFKTITMYPLQVVPYPRPNFIYSLGTQSEIGAIFPFYAQKMVYDGLATLDIQPGHHEEDKGISFSRSAWLGSQRFSSVLWNGDVDGSWEAFRAQITAGLNVQLAGIPWWASDIGGYYAQTEYHGNISDPQYQELYVRWLQYGTFSPVMRAHGRRKCLPKDQDGFGSCPNEPWSFGEAVFPHIKRFIHLRYTMDLYIKALFEEASSFGTPLQRPLFFDFATVDLYTIMYAEELKNQFMFGPNLLVAPITVPGPSEWRVYLPVDTIHKEQNNGSAKTTVWRDWWSDEIHYGGRFVTLSVSIARIPLFYRGSKEDLLAGRIIG